MITVGLTGGIGSGKSVVARLLEVFSIPVYIADTEAKRLMRESPVVRKRLCDRFGADLYQDGMLQREKLSSLIFNDPDSLTFVNAVVHPEVEADFRRWVTDRVGASIVAIESAILFESGFDRLVDSILLVTAPIDKRIERVTHRDHISAQKVKERINNQLADEQKCPLSDYVIVNDGDKALIPQVEQYLKSLTSQENA